MHLFGGAALVELFAIAADVRYTGRSLCGFEPLDGPPGKRSDRAQGFVLLLLSMVVASAGDQWVSEATRTLQIIV